MSIFERFYDFANDAITSNLGTSANPVAEAHTQSHTTEEVNNVQYASPGEVQTTIDALASQSNIGQGFDQDRGWVKLNPNAEYDEGTEIQVKPGIVLDFNGAVMTHSSDHNLVFLDNASHLRNGRFFVDPPSFSSDCVVLDASRSTDGKYAIGGAGGDEDGHATAEFIAIANDAATVDSATDGTALHLIADPEAITLGCWFDVTAFGLGRGIHHEVGTGSFANVIGQCSLTGCHTLIDHTGSQQARSYWWGELQPTGPNQFGIRNQTTSTGVMFEGFFWDPFNSGTNAIAGPQITVWNKLGADFSGHTDGSSGIIVYGRDPEGFQFYEAANDNVWTFSAKFNHLRLLQNGNIRWQAQGNGDFVTSTVEIAGGGVIRNPVRFENQTIVTSPPSSPSAGDWYIDDGSNTSSGNLAIRIYDGTAWVDQN